MVDLIGNLKIPMVGYGTFTAIDETQLETSLDVAFEAGYRHIDTANVYANEHIIGKVLQKWFASGKCRREDLFITTKLPPAGLQPDRVEEFLKKSLEKLQLEYIDLYLIHFPVCSNVEESVPLGLVSVVTKPTDLVAAWKELERQVDLGRTKAIGVSNFNIDQIGRIIKNARIPPAVNQIELHVNLQQPELVKYCQDNGLVVVSYSSLGNPGMGDFFKKNNIAPPAKVIDLFNIPEVKKIAEKHNKSVGQILLKFLVQKNIVVIPKSVTPSRIKDNIDLFDFLLDKNDVSVLEALDKGEAGRRARMAYCQEQINHPEYPFPRNH